MQTVQMWRLDVKIVVVFLKVLATVKTTGHRNGGEEPLKLVIMKKQTKTH